MSNFGGPEWIRTTEAEAKDLQSSPFDRSGTDPCEQNSQKLIPKG